MTLIKWKPQTQSYLSDFDRMWSNYHRSAQGCSGSCDWQPRVDIVENEKDYQLVVEVPGFEKSEITLRVEDGVLVMSGERKLAEETEGSSYRRVERLYGNFERRFRMPKEFDAEKIEAELKNGLLTVSIAKSEKVAGREIQVK